MEAQMIGSKIAEARKKMSLSQAQLAQRLFISPQAVGKWERGESLPDILTFNRLAKILGVDLNYFSENFPSTAGETASAANPAEPSSELASGKDKNKPGWDLSNGNWLEADFSGLKNLHEKFSSSNMQRCKFIGSDLSGLLLKSNNVDGCDFSSSDFSDSHIQSSNLAHNLFTDCSLNNTLFSKSNIYGCTFNGADLTGVVIKSGGFSGVAVKSGSSEKNTLSDTVLHHTSFIDSHIADLVFTGKLESCSFENCAFTRVTFRDAILLNTFFKNNRNLKRIRFIDCQADRITYEFLKQGKAVLDGITMINM